MSRLLLSLCYILSIVVHFVYSQIDLHLPFDFNYENRNKFFVTNNPNGYDAKYYIQDKYIYSVIESEGKYNCLDSCLNWVNDNVPKYTVAITGFDIKSIDSMKCECKGQILKMRKFQYYPSISNIEEYNKKYLFEFDLIKYKSKIYFFNDLKFAEKYCYEGLSEIAKTKRGEAITNYKVSCKEDYCDCSGNILYSY